MKRLLSIVLLASMQLMHASTAAAAQANIDAVTDPLVAVDRNRVTLIADIIQVFRSDIAKRYPGREVEEGARLGERLAKLRADRLLAASLASSFATLQSILEGT